MGIDPRLGGVLQAVERRPLHGDARRERTHSRRKVKQMLMDRMDDYLG